MANTLKKQAVNFEGKSAIITGGARGIGFSIAQKFVKSQIKVLILSRTEAEASKSALKLGPNTLSIVADVSKIKDCQKIVKKAIDAFGRIDILVNNAGIYGPISPLEKTNLDDFELTIKTNFLSQVFLSKLVIPYMKKQGGGKIINLAGGGVGSGSISANFSAYFSSKMAVAGFSESLAQELKKDNIQVNCISPGLVYTKMTDYLLKHDPEVTGMQNYQRNLEAKKTLKNSAEAAANLCLFLASSEADHITGRILSANWDNPKNLKKDLPEQLYKLRRIDNKIFKKI